MSNKSWLEGNKNRVKLAELYYNLATKENKKQ